MADYSLHRAASGFLFPTPSGEAMMLPPSAEQDLLPIPYSFTIEVHQTVSQYHEEAINLVPTGVVQLNGVNSI